MLLHRAWRMVSVEKLLAEPRQECFVRTSFTLPNRQNSPSGLGKCMGLFRISLDVPLKLGVPELHARLRCRRSAAGFMSVPKAAMYEDGRLMLGKNDVWRARQITPLHPESKP